MSKFRLLFVVSAQIHRNLVCGLEFLQETLLQFVFSAALHLTFCDKNRNFAHNHSLVFNLLQMKSKGAEKNCSNVS